MSWADIENAMWQAVVTASQGIGGGLITDKRVRWSYQSVNEPDQPHIVITFGGAVGVTQDWIKTSQNLSRPKGSEMRQQVRGVREVPFEIDVITTQTLGAGAARQIADTIRSRFRLDSIRLALRKYGISPFDTFAPVNWIPDIPGVRFRGRANLTIRCYVPIEDADEYVGYIARVTGVIVPTGIAGTGLFQSGPSGVPLVSGYTGFLFYAPASGFAT